jgi:hypothetical protein
MKVLKNYAGMLRSAKHNARAEEMERRIKAIEEKLEQEESDGNE